MGRAIKKDTKYVSTSIRIIDSTSASAETAVDYDTSGLDLWYWRNGSAKVSLTEVGLSALTSSHVAGGIEPISNGYYRLDLPSGACATGSDFVLIGGTVTGMHVIGNEHALVDYDPTDAVRLGLTSLPNAAADASGGMAISDAGGLDLDAIPTAAEVTSAVTTALIAANLDHLALTATASGDMTAEVADGTIISRMLANGDTSDFDPSTDGLQPIRDAITAGGPVSYALDSSSTLNTGDEGVTDYTDAQAAGGDAWTIGDENGDSGAIHSATSDYTIDNIAEHNMGANRIATQVDVRGHFNRSGGGGYIVEIYAYNYSTTSWDKLSLGTASTEMRDRSTHTDYTLSLNAGHTDPVTVPGEVKIGFVSTRSGTAGGDVLNLDYVRVSGEPTGGSTPQAIADAVHSALDVHLKHIENFTGEIYYVSKAGSEENSGHAPDLSLLTVAAGIAKLAAGDKLVIKAGTYDENGLALALDGLELECEIGTIFQNSTPGTVLTVSGDACRVHHLLLEPSASQIGVVVSGSYNEFDYTYPHVAGGTGWSITGEHNLFERCRADNYTATGFQVANAENIFTECIAYGAGATRGYYFSHTDAHENLMTACVSINNDTGGIEFVSGADLNIVAAHSSVGETTPYTNSGANNAIAINTDYAPVNAVQIAGATPATEIASAVATAVLAYDPPTKAEMDTAHGLLSTVAKQDIAASALATAQADLDTITGADGVLLGTTQSNYAPNVVVPDAAGVAPTAGEINAEVVDALATDTYAEPGQGAPGATLSIVAKIGFMFKQWRNEHNNDGTTEELLNDAGNVVDQKRTVSESGGTVTKSEVVSGP